MSCHASSKAVWLALPALLLAAAPEVHAQRSSQAQFRFQAMDENGDGAISRAEWRGSAQSFSRHDWNRDGVLSGAEVRIGATREAGEPDDYDQNERPEFRNWTERGFTNLDRNRDGRIARSEWFYAREGFLRADRNGDGALTRAEFLTTDVDTDREDRFDYLDTNQDGRIERGEWQWSRRSFARQDQNGDGQLTRRELTNAEISSTSGATGTSGRSVTVDAARGWVDTGIDVRSGDTLAFDATGSVTLSTNASDVADPSGSRTGRKAASAPLTDQAAGLLIARIGDAAPQAVGGRRSIAANASGRLYLSVNDDYFDDNRGAFTVMVSVQR